jgi:hypothetical protein
LWSEGGERGERVEVRERGERRKKKEEEAFLVLLQIERRPSPFSLFAPLKLKLRSPL